MAKKPSKKSFSATIEASESGGAFITLPFDVEAELGSKRPKVLATFEGVEYRGTAARMGGPDHILIIRKDIREQIGKQPGDKVKVSIEVDTAPRVVEVPKDLAAAMNGSSSAKAFWKELSYTHQREYVQWIEDAKRADTRERRVAKTVELLAEGKKSR